ncbi:DUF4064 domain-containing protein [Gracilibacillus alcaliphilus]|uniref:DUF4064 domain-containing protein n=1 Tax=Gracilibacillus alcaliphilus TaxID=1401441 RepID=UPI0019578941|nr:DUF4064 domain-containing protein [Gracilibacillus alcaliphilus]MBM7679657.1 asparagine N-glycosylation enzyme membrane subunit Stt3 [Gracilibacillus alcaliphilus]
MKRTVEVVLTIIGAVVYGFGALFGFLFRVIDGNQEFLDEVARQDPSLATEDVNLMMNFIGSAGTFLIVGSVISIIAGIIACILFRGNKQPIVASIILLVVGVVTTIITFGGAIFASIFYVIAGIMGLVRRKKPEDTVEQY